MHFQLTPMGARPKQAFNPPKGGFRKMRFQPISRDAPA